MIVYHHFKLITIYQFKIIFLRIAIKMFLKNNKIIIDTNLFI